MNIHTAGGYLNRLRSWFPEREFFMRSKGQVRFITITTRVQMLGAGLALAILLGWGLSVVSMAVAQYRASAELADLQTRSVQVANSEHRVEAYRKDIDAVAADLEKRQEFIENVMPLLPEDAVDDAALSDSEQAAAKTVSQVGINIPEAAGLARIEARQLAFVERLTNYANRRADKAATALRKLGLNPANVISSARSAQGGPLSRLASEADGSTDPRFERLGLSLTRMDALEQGLNHIPQVMPADISMISSGFGFRSDPFTGGGAMHSGLDFRGPIGAPIHAAAQGRVSFVGVKSGYGKVVEIMHGNGMMTRYAHMSRQEARVGQQVAAGTVIGAIGSTGRSTGPHLHFEVRINDRAVNPRPFLETAPDVLEEARAEFTGSSAKQNRHGA